MENLKNIIDSLLFVAEETLSLDRLKKILPQAEAEAIREAVAALQAEYDARPGGFYLAEVAGGYQFRSRPEYTPWIRRMVDPKPLRLSLEEFHAHVRRSLKDQNGVDPSMALKAVLSALHRHVSPSVLETMQLVLPREVHAAVRAAHMGLLAEALIEKTANSKALTRRHSSS